jgi:hypothetical protein
VNRLLQQPGAAVLSGKAQQMHTIRYNFCLALVLLSVTCVSAQDSTSSRSPFGEVLTLQYGIGSIAVRDEYISGDKYTGTVPVYGLTWSRHHETYDFRLHLESQRTTDLKNYGVSDEMSQFRLALDYLYPLSCGTLFSRSLFVSLGPSVGLFYYTRRQHIARSENLQSNVALASGGIRSEAHWMWTSDLRVRAAVQLTLLSLGFHSVNSNVSDQSSSKSLLPFRGLDAAAEIGVRYAVTNALYGSAAYRLDVTRVSEWDYFMSATDNLIVTVSYAF